MRPKFAPRPARQEVARAPARATSTLWGGELPPGCGSRRYRLEPPTTRLGSPVC
jgi:hypothetical protein